MDFVPLFFLLQNRPNCKVVLECKDKYGARSPPNFCSSPFLLHFPPEFKRLVLHLRHAFTSCVHVQRSRPAFTSCVYVMRLCVASRHAFTPCIYAMRLRPALRPASHPASTSCVKSAGNARQCGRDQTRGTPPSSLGRSSSRASLGTRRLECSLSFLSERTQFAVVKGRFQAGNSHNKGVN